MQIDPEAFNQALIMEDEKFRIQQIANERETLDKKWQ